MNIETIFTRSKIVRQNIGIFWPSLIRPKYLNPEQQTGTLRHKMKPPSITNCILNWKIIFKDAICLLFKNAREKLIMPRFQKLSSLLPKKTYGPISGLVSLRNGQYYKIRH